MQTDKTPPDLVSSDCATRYPLLFLHGICVRDTIRRGHWGRILSTLESHGSHIFLGYQDALGTFENNAHQIAATIEDVLLQTNSEKVNIIAHSKGGVDARCLISSLGLENKIASLTTLSSPHHGSKTIGDLFRIGKPIFKLLAFPVNAFYRALGDDSPDFFTVCRELSPRYMEEFNLNNPDLPDIYYQHYGTLINSAFNDVILAFSYLIIRICDGPNDGIVALSSTQYGRTENYKGVFCTQTRRGVSHIDIVDFRHRSLVRASRNVGSKSVDAVDRLADRQASVAAPASLLVNNIPDFFVALVAALKAAGY